MVQSFPIKSSLLYSINPSQTSVIAEYSIKNDFQVQNFSYSHCLSGEHVTNEKPKESRKKAKLIVISVA